jgi:cell division protein FtsB
VSESAGRRTSTENVKAARRLILPLLIAVVIVGVIFVAVYPAQTYLRQQDDLEAKRVSLEQLRIHNDELEDRAESLQDPAALELMAREQYGLVNPGEEAYGIVPAEEERVVLPDSWPFTQLQLRLDRHLG